MIIDQLVEILAQEFSLHSVMNMVSRISQYHRIQGSQGYFDAVKYIQLILEKNEINSTLYEYPADGKSENWGWISPISWNIKSGELWLTKPVEKRLCRFNDCPMSVLTHSKAADFEASLVNVGKGDSSIDYKNAREKVALITTSPRNIFSLAAKHAVMGLILHPTLERAAKIGDSTIQYDGFWPTAEDLSNVTAGFSISHKQFLEINQYLEQNKEVKVRFKIDANFSIETGKLHVLETEIIGSKIPSEEIVVISHLCHPALSANDNASGSATTLELILSLIRMIRSGLLSPPKRTIRFLWVPEFSGTIEWLKTYDEQRKISRRKILAVLNLDMVGQSPEKIGTPLTICFPSISTPSYLRANLRQALEKAANQIDSKNGRSYRLNYTFAPFEGGSDHLITNDLYFSIPSTMFGHEDPFHHTSADNIDKVDPLECRSVGTVVGAIAYGIATSSERFLKETINRVFLDVIDESLKAEPNITQSEELSIIQKRKLWDLLENIGLKRIISLTSLDENGILIEDMNHFSDLIKSQFNHFRRKLQSDSGDQKPEKIGQALITRNYTGPFPIKRLMRPDRREYKKIKLDAIGKDYWGGVLLELLNLADGKTPLEDIFLLLNLYYPKVSYGDVLFLVNLFIEEKILIEKGTSILTAIEYPYPY
ncbi:DUF4910 domain-containing protein [Candidatus Hodarchaeum mangrovi]